MNSLFLCLSLFIGQMNTLQEKAVVRLPPNQKAISSGYNGKLLQLINTPAVLSLPFIIPRPDAQGLPWSIDVKNLGPHAVTITGKPAFSLQVNVGQTVHIDSNGKNYYSTDTVRRKVGPL